MTVFILLDRAAPVDNTVASVMAGGRQGLRL